MKKAMTILLTFIMVLQLIPIPAFATEEIATAEDLKAFLENPENVTVAEGSTLTVQISAENKLTKVSVFCDGEVRIKKDVTIPSAVKLLLRYTSMLTVRLRFLAAFRMVVRLQTEPTAL